jgi:hypothetical protein
MSTAMQMPLSHDAACSGAQASRPRVWLTILGSIATVIGMAASGLAEPIDLYNTVSGLSSDGFDSASNTAWLANQFLTGGDAYTLDRVVIELDAVPTASGSNVRLELFSNLHDPDTATDSPYTLIGAFTNPGLLDEGKNDFQATGLPALASNATYWVVLRVAGVGGVKWNYTFGTPGGLLPTDVSTFSADGGGNWFPNSTGSPYMMRVDVFVTPVPEPSTYAMGLAGVGAVIAPSIRRRFRRRGTESTLA